MFLYVHQQNKLSVDFITGEMAVRMEQLAPSNTRIDLNAETLTLADKETASLIINRHLLDQQIPQTTIQKLVSSLTQETGAKTKTAHLNMF